MNDRIRKDDLDALGEMAGFVGMFMSDFAQKTTPETRHKLFASGNPNVRETLVKALVSDEKDLAQKLVPDNTQYEDAKLPPPPPPAGHTDLSQLSPLKDAEPVKPLPVPASNQPQQLELFTDQQLQQTNNFKTINDVINHFSNRLDTLEEMLRTIKTYIININNNMPKPRKKKVIQYEIEKPN